MTPRDEVEMEEERIGVEGGIKLEGEEDEDDGEGEEER